MIVDDDADIANLIGEVLRDEGFATRVVSDSRQALDAFREFQPDLETSRGFGYRLIANTAATT